MVRRSPFTVRRPFPITASRDVALGVRTSGTSNHGVRTSPVARGFTLLELILVLMVIGIGSAIAAARLGGMRGTVGVDLAAQRLIDQARRSQHLAATSGHQVRLRLDLKANTVSVAMLDDVRERKPDDGQDDQVALSSGADELTLSFARSDAVGTGSGMSRISSSTASGTSSASSSFSSTYKSGAKNGDQTIDVLFAPDARCEPAGTVTVASKNKSAAVRLFAGARLPELVVDTSLDNKASP